MPKALRKLYRFLFPAPVNHQWHYTEHGMYRTCTCCGEEESLDMGGGWSGSSWMQERRGNNSAQHPPFTKQQPA